jgi:hypothetical protein
MITLRQGKGAVSSALSSSASTDGSAGWSDLVLVFVFCDLIVQAMMIVTRQLTALHIPFEGFIHRESIFVEGDF